jgi:Domain of unknown function (DUF4214)
MSEQSKISVSRMEEVLSLEGAAFLGQAYLMMLGRPVDPDGFRHYDAQMRLGVSKLAILAELRASKEGRAYSANAPDPLALLNRTSLGVPSRTLSVQDVLRLRGPEFVNQAYMSIIGRPPDVATCRRYVGRLWDGADKLDLLLEIFEANPNASKIPDSARFEESVRNLRGSLYPVAGNIRELLELDDVDFIDCAYKTLLGRAPDATGLRNYLQLLRSGASKMRVVARICFSTEGRRRFPALPGLKRAIFQYAMARFWLTGWWFRPIAQVEGDTPVECRLRVIENNLMRMTEDREREAGDLDSSADDVAALLRVLSNRSGA